MIFKEPEHVVMILDGKKTQTRRLGNKRWNVGVIHPLKRSRFEKPFAKAEILEVWQERLIEIKDEDVKAEGYETREEFFRAFGEINRIQEEKDGVDLPSLEVWAIKFRVVQKLEGIRHEVLEPEQGTRQRRLEG